MFTSKLKLPKNIRDGSRGLLSSYVTTATLPVTYVFEEKWPDEAEAYSKKVIHIPLKRALPASVIQLTACFIIYSSVRRRQNELLNCSRKLVLKCLRRKAKRRRRAERAIESCRR